MLYGTQGYKALAEQMEKLVYLKITKASNFLSPCFLNVLNVQNLGFPKYGEGSSVKMATNLKINKTKQNKISTLIAAAKMMPSALLSEYGELGIKQHQLLFLEFNRLELVQEQESYPTSTQAQPQLSLTPPGVSQVPQLRFGFLRVFLEWNGLLSNPFLQISKLVFIPQSRLVMTTRRAVSLRFSCVLFLFLFLFLELFCSFFFLHFLYSFTHSFIIFHCFNKDL